VIDNRRIPEKVVVVLSRNSSAGCDMEMITSILTSAYFPPQIVAQEPATGFLRGIGFDLNTRENIQRLQPHLSEVLLEPLCQVAHWQGSPSIPVKYQYLFRCGWLLSRHDRRPERQY
jgi:hypothetical protein